MARLLLDDFVSAGASLETYIKYDNPLAWRRDFKQFYPDVARLMRFRPTKKWSVSIGHVFLDVSISFEDDEDRVNFLMLMS